MQVQAKKYRPAMTYQKDLYYEKFGKLAPLIDTIGGVMMLAGYSPYYTELKDAEKLVALINATGYYVAHIQTFVGVKEVDGSGLCCYVDVAKMKYQAAARKINMDYRALAHDGKWVDGTWYRVYMSTVKDTTH